MSRFSATASRIQSQSFNFSRSSSKFPMVMLRTTVGSTNAGGLAFLRFSTARLASAFRSAVACGARSRSSTGNPAFAICAARRAPMVPAPRTATFWIEPFVSADGISPLYRRRFAAHQIQCAKSLFRTLHIESLSRPRICRASHASDRMQLIRINSEIVE